MDTDWYLLLSMDCRDYFVYDQYSFSLINATIFCTLQHKEGKHF